MYIVKFRYSGKSSFLLKKSSTGRYWTASKPCALVVESRRRRDGLVNLLFSANFKMWTSAGSCPPDPVWDGRLCDGLSRAVTRLSKIKPSLSLQTPIGEHLSMT